MKDLNKPCQHCVSDNTVYKEVVIIGNGPSGIMTSYMLAGHEPRARPVPAGLPLDEMLVARLRAQPPRQSLWDARLQELAEGLEGRSRNPVPLLMDNLLNPCADQGLLVDSLVEWEYDVEKQIDHVVLGKGPPGGSWHTFAPDVLTLSPGGWLALPPHAALPGCARERRARTAAVADYYRRYVRAQGLQRYFRSGVVVTAVTPRPPCAAGCRLAARWTVTGYDTTTGRVLRYACARVVLASGACDRPGTLAARGLAARALHDLTRADVALAAAPRDGAPVLVVGSGLSAADAVAAARRARRHVAHVYRARSSALDALAAPLYSDYTEVRKMMHDGSSGCHEHYTALPDRVVVEVQPLEAAVRNGSNSELHDIVAPKRVKLLDLTTNEVQEMIVSVIFVLIGSKPDLHFLPSNFDLSCIDVSEKPVEKLREVCAKCNNKHAAKRKMEESERKCFLRHHWYYIKSMVGQGIQSCKSRYWDHINESEINGNGDASVCILSDCNRRGSDGDGKTIKSRRKDEALSGDKENECDCQLSSLQSGGLGFGVDPKKPVDCRTNPVDIDKTTHEVLNAPKGMYALGPLTSDNFVRFICGGALAAVAHMRRERKLQMTD